MKLNEALARITELENELNTALTRVAWLESEIKAIRAANSGSMNPAYIELLAHLVEGPKSISELAELMMRENRIVSQWLHALKVRHGANIITLADGRKYLTNPEAFVAPLEKESSACATPKEKVEL